VSTRKSNKSDTLQIFDPRKNEDYVFGPYPDGSFISSITEEMIVIHSPPGLELVSSENRFLVNQVLRSFELENGVGFICGFAISKLVEDIFPDDSTINGQGRLGFFPATEGNFKHYLNVFKNLEYGELTVGFANSRLVEVDSFMSIKNNKKHSFGDFELLSLVAKFKDIRWLLSFYADTGHGLLIAKREETPNVVMEYLQSQSKTQ
jgi:hypothetical protein